MLNTELEAWVIRKGGYFYRENYQGYTSEIYTAGHYTQEDAEAEAKRVEGSAHHVSEFGLCRTHKTSDLCVSGPIAGQRRAVSHEDRFRVAVLLPAVLSELDKANPLDIVQMKDFVYRRISFEMPEGSTSFWAPEGQTTQQTLTMLLEAYEELMILKGENK